MSSQRDDRRARERRISLSVTVVAGERRLVGRLRQLSSKGCRASFEAELVRDLAQRTVELEFAGLLLLEPLRAQAEVKSRTEVEGRVLLTLEFSEPERVQQQVPYVLQVEFTRRAAPRVAVEGRPRVELCGERGSGSARLVEISSGGAGLHVPFDRAQGLSQGDEVGLVFHLPEHGHEFRLRAAVRALQPVEGGFGCSLQFVDNGAPDFAHQIELIGTLVDRRLEKAPPSDDLREAG